MIKRRIYLCICEGQQETMYLAHIARLLTHFPERVVKFNTTIGSPSELKKHYEEYDSAALFDQDGRQNAFEEGIRVCQALDRLGQRSRSKKHVYHAYSNVNFDLWLILHKEDFTRPVASNDAYVPDVRRIYRLGREADIKEINVIDRTCIRSHWTTCAARSIGRMRSVQPSLRPMQKTSMALYAMATPIFPCIRFCERC